MHHIKKFNIRTGKETMKIRAEINKIEKQEIKRKKIHETKSWFLYKENKTYKHQKKREETNYKFQK